MGRLTFFALLFRLDQRLRPNGSALVSVHQSPPRVTADVIGYSSLISPYFFVYSWTSEKVKWFSLIKT